MNYIIASSHKNYESLVNELNQVTKDNFYLIDSKEKLKKSYIRSIQPKYIFFPHWSYIIPREIYSKYTCLMFHATDLPYGRGGSPIQNLIARGIYETKISVFRCSDGIDTGPIYLKKSFSLYGNGDEIFYRLKKVFFELILILIENNITPVAQKGKIVSHKRRKPKDGNVANLKGLEKMYDYIRMLDIDGYPKAFLETKNFRFELKRPTIKMNRVVADVEIYDKEKK